MPQLTLALISGLFELLPSVIAGVSGAVAAYNHGAGVLKTAAAEKRDITAAEWDDWSSRNKAVHDAIQGA